MGRQPNTNNTTQRKESIRLPYISGLDGIRALAVIAVIFYHANVSWALGGFLGVETFFVLSGYLITSLLLREWQFTGDIDLSYFWLRRARRLLPALWFFLLILPPVVTVLAPDALSRLWEDTLPALGYVTNWYYVLRDTSYFEQYGRAPLLQHLWSLAVEEQFYIFWPLILIGLLRIFRKKRSRVIPILLSALMGISVLWMILLYEPYTDPSRVYYGTDTRAAGFLMGAVLSFFWKPWKLPERMKSAPIFRVLFEAAGVAAVGGMLLIYSQYHEYQTSLYRGRRTLTSAVSRLFIITPSHPATLLGQLFETPVMRWIGRRSYGIYLWHWPIFSMARPGFDVNFPFWPLFAIKIALTLIAAEISYQWIEQPIRKEGFKAFFRHQKSLIGKRAAPTILTVLMASFLLLDAGNLLITRGGSDIPALPLTRKNPHPVHTQTPAPADPDASPVPSPTPPAAAGDLHATERAPTPLKLTPLVTSPPPDQSSPTTNPDVLDQGYVVRTPTMVPYVVSFIGDSVMRGAEDDIQEAINGKIYIDTARSRNMEDLLELTEKLAQKQALAPIVVIHLGTNRLFEERIFNQVVDTLIEHGVRRILFVNVHRPIRWEDLANERFRNGVERWEEAELLDWHQVSRDQPGWFGGDRVHLTRYGKEAYVKLLLEGLTRQSP